MRTFYHRLDKLSYTADCKPAVWYGIGPDCYTFWLAKNPEGGFQTLMLPPVPKDTNGLFPMFGYELFNPSFSFSFIKKNETKGDYRLRWIYQELNMHWNLGAGKGDRKDLFVYQTSPDKMNESYLVLLMARIKIG